MKFPIFPFFALALFLPPPLFGQSAGQVFLTGLHFDTLTYDDGVLFWKGNCGLIGPPTRIQRTPSTGGSLFTYYDVATCGVGGVKSQNIAVNAARSVFWATGNGTIVTLPADAPPGTVPAVLANMAAPAVQSVHVAVSNTHVYWTETSGEQGTEGSIYRAPIAGGTRSTVTTLGSPGGGPMNLFAITVPGNFPQPDTEVVYYRRWGGALEKQWLRIALPWNISTLAASVQGVARADGKLYFVEANGTGASAIRSVPMNNTTVTTHHASIAQSPTAAQINHLAADAQSLYWQELRNGSGPIMRRRLGTTTTDVISVLLDPFPLNAGLVSDARSLFWGEANTSIIKRLPVDAAALTYNLKADNIELVQAIQRSDQSVPLVENKPGWARLFGRIQSTNSGLTSMPMTAILRGYLNGNELAGSPLIADMGEHRIYTREQDRTEQKEGWWFRLPQAWMKNGIQLYGEVNPAWTILETTRADNSVTKSFSMEPRKGITVWMHPLRTNQDTITGNNPWLQLIFDRAESLLPTANLNIEFPGGPVIEEWQGTPLPWSFGPYELSADDDDSTWIFIKLGLRATMFTVPDVLNPDNMHHGALFKSFGNRAFNGKGMLSMNLLISDVDYAAGENANYPRSGVTLAHELAHNFGREHVDCNLPPTDEPDAGYPYPPCTLSASSPPHVGFDPITRTLIHPARAGDLLTYATRRWTSDYTWRALYNMLEPGPPIGAALRTPRSPTGTKLLLAGTMSADGEAQFEPGVRLPDAAAVTAAAALLAKGSDTTAFQLRVLGAGGAVLETAPVSVYHTDSTGVKERRPFFAVMNEDTAAVSVTLVRTAQPVAALATLTGGGGAPVVGITTPAAGQVAGTVLAVRWTASDPEGQPLRHTVRYSHDGGISWRVLAEDLRLAELDVPMSQLPGGPPNSALIEVLASDGLRTGAARSAAFSVALRPPQPHIFLETPAIHNCTATAAAPVVYQPGEKVILKGRADDPEDPPLPDSALVWSVTGPRTATGTGSELFAGVLPPGNYTAGLRATDSDGLFADATAPFTVAARKITDAPVAPVLDGITDDAAYALDRRPLPLRFPGGETALISMARNGSFLYVAVSALLTNAVPRPAAVISVNPDAGTAATPQADDVRFIAYADGQIASERGNGAAFVRDATALGFTARVSASGGRWNAEFRLALSTLGGWNGQTIRMDVAAGDLHWFNGAAATATRPDQWAAVQMITDANPYFDGDGDGMADAWELTHLDTTSGDGSGDRDHDGQNDFEEYQAGTDPGLPSSQFNIAGFRVMPTGIEVRWPSKAGHCYSIEESADLREFTTVVSDLPGTGGELLHLIPLPDYSPVFLRVRARILPP